MAPDALNIGHDKGERLTGRRDLPPLTICSLHVIATGAEKAFKAPIRELEPTTCYGEKECPEVDHHVKAERR
jgi:hypothetical protein